MKKNKLFLLISIVTVLLVGLASVSYAAVVYDSPAEIVAGLTGKNIDQVTADRQSGQSFGAQAAAAGKLEEFQTAKLELYKQRLDQAVADKRITQEEADELYDAMKLRLENCTGSGTCAGQGSGFGMGRRGGRGLGAGNGVGCGMGGGNCLQN